MFWDNTGYWGVSHFTLAVFVKRGSRFVGFQGMGFRLIFPGFLIKSRQGGELHKIFLFFFRFFIFGNFGQEATGRPLLRMLKVPYR